MHRSLVNRNHVIVLSLIWLLIHTVLFFYPGVRLELFDSKVYTNAGNHFMQLGSFEKSHQIFYAIPIALIGLFNSLPNGLFVFIIFQSLISAIATVAIYRSASTLFNNSKAGLIAGILFLLWWDTVQWNTALLTESLFCSLICFLMMGLIRFKDSRRDYLVLFIFFWLLPITRPTGIIFLVSIIVFLFVKYKAFFQGETSFKLTVVAFMIVIAVLGAISMFSIWDFSDQYARGNIVTYIDTAGETDFGLRIDNTKLVLPNEDDHPLVKMISFVVHNPIHFIEAGTLKIFYLLSGYRPYFSFVHNTFNVLWHTMIYCLFIIGYRNCYNKPIRTFVFTVVIVNCLLVGISTVDWDNRFYVPMVPGLVLISAGGGLNLLNRFSGNRMSKKFL